MNTEILGNERDRYSKSLSDMIKIATVSSDDAHTTLHLDEFLDYVALRYPLFTKNCERIEVGGGIMAIWKGQNHDAPLVLMSHLDVAPALGEWKYPPFDGIILDGIIHGRGSADTKSSLCAILESVEKLMRENYTPLHDIYILSSSREEVAGIDAKNMANFLQTHNIKPKLLVDEGGAVIDKPLNGINGQFAMLAMSERSSAKLILKGDKNNIEKFVSSAKKKNFVPCQFPSEVEEMFRRMTPYMSFPLSLLFKHLRQTKRLLVNLLPKVSNAAGAMVKPSVSYKIENNENILTVASTFHQDIEKVVDAIVNLAKKYDISVSIDTLRKAPRPTDFNNPMVKLVEQSVIKVFSNTIPTPFIIFGGTDARHFVEISDCVVRFAPLIMNNEIISTVHKENEYIYENSVFMAVKFYTQLILDFNSQK